MENADRHSTSTAPLTWHDFLERMRQPSAADFVKAIKSFIVTFSKNSPNPERDSAAVQEFLKNMESAFRAHPLWAGCSEEELESAGEGLEKYVMTKLFPHVFASVPDDVKLDDQLHGKMALLQQFIQPENLDIRPTFQNETSFLLAQKELQKINMYKAPRDKLVCILSYCKAINNILLNSSMASNDHPHGADDFLPVLIYVTIKANTPQLYSNLLYIQRYRGQSRLVGEAAYFFTNMLSAMSFVLNINAESLSMDEAEFDKNMESARSLLSGLSAAIDELPTRSSRNFGHDFKSESSLSSLVNKEEEKEDHSRVMKMPSFLDLENKGATVLLNEDQLNQVFQDYPYLFSHVGDLTVNDVEDLLNNYKQLVFKYVCLSRGIDMNKELKKDAGRVSDGLDAVSHLEVDNLESELLPQNKSNTPQHGETDETS